LRVGHGAAPAAPGSQVRRCDLFKSIRRQILVDGFGSVELFEQEPLGSVERGHQPAVATDAFVRDRRLVLGVVEERDGVEGSAEHKHTAVLRQDFLEGRIGTVAVIKGVAGGDPFSQGADGGAAIGRVVASDGAGPGADDFVQNAVIPGRVRYSLVEHGYVEFGGIIFKVLKIDVGGECSRRSDGDCAPGDGAHGTDAGLSHDDGAR